MSFLNYIHKVFLPFLIFNIPLNFTLYLLAPILPNPFYSLIIMSPLWSNSMNLES